MKTGKFFNPGGWNHTDITKQKMSDTRMGENNPMYGKEKSSSHKKKISNTLMGHKRSKESINKQSKSIMGENNPMYGKTHTISSKQKMSENSKGQGQMMGKDNSTHKQAGIYLITYPDGHKEKIQNLRLFCREHNLWRGSMYDICNNKRSTKYKGFWVERLELSHQQKCKM